MSFSFEQREIVIPRERDEKLFIFDKQIAREGCNLQKKLKDVQLHAFSPPQGATLLFHLSKKLLAITIKV